MNFGKAVCDLHCTHSRKIIPDVSCGRFTARRDEDEERLSILSDFGVAILGYSVGDTIEWEFPEDLKRIRIEMLGFQPEATKQYEL